MATESGGELVPFARGRLLQRIEAARQRIWLVSPYLTLPTAIRIGDAATKSGASEKRLVTALTPRSAQVGTLEPKALARLQECDFAIASLVNLHAKVSLIDDSWGLVGSGNLTGAGLGDDESGGNYELGVVLTPAQIDDALKLVADWWAKAEAVSSEDIAWHAALPKLPKSPSGGVGPKLPLPRSEKLAEILAEDPATAASRSYWINTNYHDPKNERWWKRNWVSDSSPKSYELTDLLEA